VLAGFRWRNLRKKDQFEDLGVGARIILKYIFNKWDGGMDWIYLVQKWVMFGTFVIAVRNLRVPYNAGYFLIR
jgi:hypothetical protein